MATSHVYKLSAYPKEVPLRDGASAVLKPMTPEDADALLHFFLRVPPDERYYLKEDVTSPKVIQQWAAQLDYDRALPLLAWVDGRIVANGTLHRTRAGARRHVGEVRIVVDPEYRNQGLGTTIIRELAAIANENGLERLLYQAVAGREDIAIKAAEAVGFVRVGVLPSHAKDLDGHLRDIVLLEMPLGDWFKWWGF
ncbi:MAG: GNAT family N-acetyltransferase [Chloroflexi bacterium]|nr:GNAT family N-acetyltransferase [Chloroflexota bacterium]